MATKKSVERKVKVENAEDVFTNSVSIGRCSDEDIEILLGKISTNDKEIDISHRVFMTIPQFFKFKDMINNVGDQLVEAIEDLEKKK